MWPLPEKCHFLSGYVVRTTTADAVSSTAMTMPSPNFWAPSASEEDTVMWALMRISGTGCDEMRIAPWL